MLHKTTKLKTPDNHVVRVRLHSVDGRTWTASSPRQAMREQLAFHRRRRIVYASASTALNAMALDDIEVCIP